MTKIERIEVLIKLGENLNHKDDRLLAHVKRSFFSNKWFDEESVLIAIDNIVKMLLDRQKLEDWANGYDVVDDKKEVVGLVLAGNIPLVGWFDIQCVFVSGNICHLKLSDKDPYLIPYFIKLMVEMDERVEAYFKFVDRLKGFEKVIATGSNNTARFFEQYFAKAPNIIRKNRNSIAVINGNETELELESLADDIFLFYGLGCRNVSKLFVPLNYNFKPLIDIFTNKYQQKLMNHTKYRNNFDYNHALNSVNGVPFIEAGCVIMLENPRIQSRIATLHYEFYSDIRDVEKKLNTDLDKIQCILTNEVFKSINQSLVFGFGKAQSPGLKDYADGVDTMKFLN